MSRIRISLLLLVLLSVLPARSQDSADLYRQAVDRQQHGDLAGAVELYRKLLVQDAANAAARSNLGAALAGLGRYDEAIPEYQQALKSAPEQFHAPLQRNLALAYYKSGRLQQAASLLVTLPDVDAAVLAADCFLQLGEPARALELLEPRATQAGNEKAFAYLLGIAYLKVGKIAEGQRVLDPILKDTSSAEGNYALGMAMFSSSDYPAAMRALQHAIQLNPALPHLYSYYGQTLVFTGDPDGALEAFRQQLAGDPNDYDANYQSAAILSRRRHYADAEPLLRQASRLRPNSSQARLLLCEVLIALGKSPDARRELEAMVRDWPEFGPPHARLADLYLKAGLRTEAARERNLAAQFTPKAEAIPEVGPKRGSAAPSLQLTRSDGHGAVAIPTPAAGKPAVLVFGSYTCPNFRKAAPALNELAKTFGSRASFLLVYIREAHATDQWQSTINEREHVQLAPSTSVEQRSDYAMMCTRKLQLDFPSAVDGLDNAAEQAYQAWPSRVYVIAADGRVRYSSALIEEEFDRAALESAIQSVVGAASRTTH